MNHLNLNLRDQLLMEQVDPSFTVQKDLSITLVQLNMENCLVRELTNLETLLVITVPYQIRGIVLVWEEAT